MVSKIRKLPLLPHSAANRPVGSFSRSLRMNVIYGAISLPGNEKLIYPDEVCVGHTTSVGEYRKLYNYFAELLLSSLTLKYSSFIFSPPPATRHPSPATCHLPPVTRHPPPIGKCCRGCDDVGRKSEFSERFCNSCNILGNVQVYFNLHFRSDNKDSLHFAVFFCTFVVLLFNAISLRRILGFA